MNIQMAVDELHRAFKFLNQNFFDGELPEPAITIQMSGKRRAMGWCSTKEVWGNKEGTIRKHELNISAEYLDIELMETMDTMMHEMVHLYNAIHGVQDVSRGGSYHNKRFKQESERRGFYFPEGKAHPTYGWSFSKLTEETKAKIQQLGIREDAFRIARRSGAVAEDRGGDGKGEGKKSNSYKWVCSSCGLKVRSTKENVKIKCGECDLMLVRESGQEDDTE